MVRLGGNEIPIRARAPQHEIEGALFSLKRSN